LRYARLRALETGAPFEDIARRFERDMEIVCCHTRDCCDKPWYKRTIYCVEVAPQLFDVIFNSQSGYRGAYFQSPERGLSANGLVLSTVTPRLVAWTRDRCIHQDPAFAEKSLSAASAKLWLAEESLSLSDRCKGEWSASVRADVAIINGRWECNFHTHPEWGRQAPCFRKVRFSDAEFGKNVASLSR
jgi:hypothetical protein